MSDATTRPSTRRREQTRARLLDAAHEIFGEVGMDGASVEAICERAGFTRGAFYSNFDSKDELFLALVSRMAEAKMDEVAGRVRDLSTSAPLQPAALVRQVLGVSLGEHTEPQLMSEIRTQALRDPRMAQAYLAWHERLQARVAAVIRTVVDTQGVRLRLSVDEAARLLLSLSEESSMFATIEGKSEAQIGAVLADRLEHLVTLLVDVS
ncbi:TetR/AcrR family transcriptional regulator [Microbacterium invictum]|uniref:AcrR family transcriptional regulator n=1 Tax=Microbacterium invictum TaxID=515415 RepID=A0AA40SLG5_9MICO|nr:TetR/AcrR family transcriptional regulator [Microbacterium invictum]MBB4138279.1 AcrR family transcriptional regulator [Microbacterium invictum]